MPTTIEIITSDALAPTKHGFFTRRGGASSGIFTGLNCGLGSSDQRAAVDMNRLRVAHAMGAEALTTVHQAHTATVVLADAPFETPPVADAMVTKTPGVVLSVLTADCQPVLFADPQAGVIGAAHAGWRGALDGVLENVLTQMEQLGANRANTTAIIGPCISQPAYEVGPEFQEGFLQADPDNARFFIKGNGDRMLFDLPGYGLFRLQSAGVGHAEWTRHCTYAAPTKFYSYRRSCHEKEADFGRLVSCITL